MRKLFLVVLVVGILAFSPTVATPPTHTSHSFSLVSAAPQGTITRVYGVNYAPEIISAIDRDSYESFVEGLSSIGSRFQKSGDNNLNAREWISDQLTTLSDGRIEVEFVGIYNNVVGKLPGYLPGEHEAFVITSHYDSADDSPGANDNGSGVAAVLELARVLSMYEWPVDIYFVATNYAVPLQWDTPYKGSNELAQIWVDEGVEIAALYNVDMILYPNSYADYTERVLLGYDATTPYPVSHYWADLAKMMGNLWGYDVFRVMDSYTFPVWNDGDHLRFYQNGYESVVSAFESGYATDYISGTRDDVYDYSRFDYHLGRALTGAIGGSIAFSMARAYGERTHLHLTGTLSHGISRTFHIAISTSTSINISSRWFGGGSEYRLYSPGDSLIASAFYPGASAWESTNIFHTTLSSPGLYHLEIGNLAEDNLGYEINILYDTDADGNGVLDKNEYWLDSALFNTDDDADELSNAMEIILGTDRNDPDTDSDFMYDGWEYENGFDPLDPSDGNDDAENDGVSNVNEFILGTNPWSSDTDSDKLPDLWEIENGLDPLVDDAALDNDGDGKTNLEEYEADTNPQEVEQASLNLLVISVPSVVLCIALIGVYMHRKYSSLIT